MKLWLFSHVLMFCQFCHSFKGEIRDRHKKACIFVCTLAQAFGLKTKSLCATSTKSAGLQKLH